MSDKKILKHSTVLVDEEHRLRGEVVTPGQNAARLKQVAEQLAQCRDLLRQRRPKHEFGADPAAAVARHAGTVEGYIG